MSEEEKKEEKAIIKAQELAFKPEVIKMVTEEELKESK